VGIGEYVAALKLAVVATGVEDSSVNSAVPPRLPPADHGSTRYSAVSDAVLAGNVTQPESLAGSSDVYAPAAREICEPDAPQDGR
jgi:hypothetical protein